MEGGAFFFLFFFHDIVSRAEQKQNMICSTVWGQVLLRITQIRNVQVLVIPFFKVSINLTIVQPGWREPQICQFLSLKSHYIDNFPVWPEGAPYLSISFFKKWLFWQFSSLAGGSSIWRIPQRRIATCRVPPRTQLLYLRLPTNRNALPGTPPRTEMLYLGLPTNRSRKEKSKYWKNLDKSIKT